MKARVGLITYMRTDSVSLADEAVAEIRDLIADRYGKANVPEEVRVYKTKAKNAQEAHEGIRPTSVMRTPESLKDRLDADQFKLYSLIWKRTVACQMVPADIRYCRHRHGASKQSGYRYACEPTARHLVEPGFIAVYQEGSDDVKDDEADRTLPPVEENQVLDLTEFRADQHFTDPPPRYTEASLVKALGRARDRPAIYLCEHYFDA